VSGELEFKFDLCAGVRELTKLLLRLYLPVGYVQVQTRDAVKRRYLFWVQRWRVLASSCHAESGRLYVGFAITIVWVRRRKTFC
jgi:hypothetical protein